MPMPTLARAVIAAIILALTTSVALADDWVAVRLRGVVLELVDGEWVKLARGDVVPEARVIRTLKTGNVELQRGQETLSVGPNSQIRIFDEEGGARPFTTVQQSFGTVSVEAEVRNVQHFAVETPYLAAVVKGTKFIVTSDDKGAKVEVKRGKVAVESKTHQSVLLAVGQSASFSTGGKQAGQLVVSGRGNLPTVSGDASSSSGGTSSSGGGSATGGVTVNANVGGAVGVKVEAGGGKGLTTDIGVGNNVNAHVGVGGDQIIKLKVKVGPLGLGLGL